MTGEAVSDPDVVDEARGALTATAMAAVEEFLVDDARGPSPELMPTRSGVLALLEDGAASFGSEKW